MINARGQPSVEITDLFIRGLMVHSGIGMELIRNAKMIQLGMSGGRAGNRNALVGCPVSYKE